MTHTSKQNVTENLIITHYWWFGEHGNNAVIVIDPHSQLWQHGQLEHEDILQQYTATHQQQTTEMHNTDNSGYNSNTSNNSEG